MQNASHTEHTYREECTREYDRAAALRMPPDHPRILHIQAKLEALRKSLFRFPGLPPQHDDLEPAE